MYMKVVVRALPGLILGMQSALAGDNIGASVSHASQASAHSAMSALHALAASGRVVLGVSAVPLLVSGSVGTVSGRLGSDMLEAANAPIGTPLVVTEETFSVGPPPDAVLRDTQGPN